jgi:hypothetical protein
MKIDLSPRAIRHRVAIENFLLDNVEGAREEKAAILRNNPHDYRSVILLLQRCSEKIQNKHGFNALVEATKLLEELT